MKTIDRRPRQGYPTIQAVKDEALGIKAQVGAARNELDNENDDAQAKKSRNKITDSLPGDAHPDADRHEDCAKEEKPNGLGSFRVKRHEITTSGNSRKNCR